jgi:hypothetical protein
MYVSLDYVVSFAKTIVKTADDMDTNIWREWVYVGALIHLGISDDEIDVSELKPQDFVAPFPPNLRSILNLSLFDANGNQLAHKFRAGKQRIYRDERLSVTSVGSSTNINNSVPVDVSSDAYKLILGTNGDIVDRILIRYFKYPIDQNGNPLVREEDVFACAMFIKFMQAIRDNSNRSEIQQYDLLWKQAADKAKADKRMKSVTPEIATTIMKDWMRLIPSFDFKQY